MFTDYTACCDRLFAHCDCDHGDDGDFKCCHCCGEKTHTSELIEIAGEGKCCGPCRELFAAEAAS